MKKLLIIATIALSSLILAPVAQASNIAQNLCEYVQADNKTKLRSYLKQNKLKIRQVFSGTECNGLNLVVFANSKNSIKTGSLMIGKLPKKTVATFMNDLTTAELVAVANKRVNG
jgi:hypothetical protein